MKQFLAFIFCVLALSVSAQDTQIRKGGGGAGGSATNAVATIRKDGTPIVNGATVIDFTNAAGSVVTVTADGTTARVGIPQGGALPSYVLTNADTRTVEFTSRITNSSSSGGGFWSADSIGFISLSSATDYILMSQPQGGILATLDGWILGDANSTKTILSLSTNTSFFPSNLWVQGTNFAKQIKLTGGQAASSLLRLDSATNLATVTVGANLSFDGTTLSATGGGGGSSSNFFDVNITNTLQRTVWWAGSTTNLTVPWGVTNRIIWHPASNAGLSLSGTPGTGTNEQIIHLTAILTNSGITSIVMPTNGIDGLPPFFLTAPSTNEFDIIFNGSFVYIVSYQSPSTGVGQTAVVQTNATTYGLTSVGGTNINGYINNHQFLTFNPAITASNIVLSFATNSYFCVGLTNIIFTNLVEQATGVDHINVYVQNTIGANVTLVWPAYGAQHGYFFRTNANNAILADTTLGSGQFGVASFTRAGTNIFGTWTEWP